MIPKLPIGNNMHPPKQQPPHPTSILCQLIFNPIEKYTPLY